MRVNLVVVAPTVENYLRMGEADYVARLARLCTFSCTELRVKGEKGKRSEEEQMAIEAPLLLHELEGKRNVVLLDVEGEAMSSTQFADMLRRIGVSGGGEITFAIGGPYGFAKSVLQRHGACRLSLSRMTFTHQMVRLIFLEQLYRGLMIMRGGHYHH